MGGIYLGAKYLKNVSEPVRVYGLAGEGLPSEETGFRVERRRAVETTFAAVDTAAAEMITFDDATVVEGETYAYRVVAYRGDADGEPSNEVTVRAVQNESPSVPSAPEPANGAQGIEPDSLVTLGWTATDADPEDALTYDILFGDSRILLEGVSQGQTEATFPLTAVLSGNRVYFWQVVVHDPKGVSRRSPIWAFSTVVERVSIPNSFFIMGTRPDHVHPGNPVRVGDFNIDRFEVTNGQYASFLNQALEADQVLIVGPRVYDAPGRLVYLDLSTEDFEIGDPDSDIRFLPQDSIFVVVGGRENFPAIEVSWYGADAYARFLGRRLPFESEWEKAARGTSTEFGDTTFVGVDTVVVGLGFPFPWGTELELNRGNFLNSADPFESQTRVRSTPVGFYDGSTRGGYATESGSSFFGLEDMAGNVWEWCSDWFDLYQNPHRPPQNGNFRIVRGGSYNTGISSSATWNRSFLSPEVTDRIVGFRTAASGLLN